MRTFTLLLTLLIASLLLSACGFHLRGQAGMPFKTLYLDASMPDTPFIIELQRNLESNQIKLVASPTQADVVLNIVSEISDKQILSLGGSGRVNGFRLTYRVSLRAYDLKQQNWIPAEVMAQQRDYSYNDNEILAKNAEEALLIQGMRSEMVQQIVRRLGRAKPQPQ